MNRRNLIASLLGGMAAVGAQEVGRMKPAESVEYGERMVVRLMPPGLDGVVNSAMVVCGEVNPPRVHPMGPTHPSKPPTIVSSVYGRNSDLPSMDLMSDGGVVVHIARSMPGIANQTEPLMIQYVTVIYDAKS